MPGTNSGSGELIIISRPFNQVFTGYFTFPTGWPAWAAAWGVPNQAEPLSYYQSTNNVSGARPSVFCGWDVDIGGSPDWGNVQNFWLFREYWMGNWSVSEDIALTTAFDEALEGSSWVDQSHYNHLKVYGYSAMGFFDYNYAGDWP